MSMNYGEIAGTHSRPIAVMIIGAVLLILGIISIVLGVLMLTDILDPQLNQLLSKYPELSPILKYGAIIFTMGGLINVLLGFGFVLMWKAAWYVSIIMFIATIISSILFIALSEYTISNTILIATASVVIISLLMILCMFSTGAKSYFLD